MRPRECKIARSILTHCRAERGNQPLFSRISGSIMSTLVHVPFHALGTVCDPLETGCLIKVGCLIATRRAA
jgi:hypothetical protein